MNLATRIVESQRSETRRRWLRQTVGVFRATRQVVFRPPAPTRAVVTWLVTQASLIFLLVLPLHVAGQTVPVQAASAAAVVAGLLLLVGHVSLLVGAEADALREVEQKVLDTLVASPLQGSSYLAGKVAFWQWAQLFQFACNLPLLALCNALGVLGLVDVIAAAAVLQASTLVFTTQLIARVQRRQVLRRKGSRFVLAGSARAAGGLAIGMMIGLLAALGLGAAAQQGGPAASVGLALAGVVPSVALTSLIMPSLAHSVGTLSVPAWAWGLGLTACAATVVIADARRRWKPPPSDRGVDLRVGMLLVVVPVAAVAVTATRTANSATWLMAIAAQAVLVALPPWAAASAFSNVGRGRRVDPVGLFVMRRDTAGRYVAACVALVLVVVAALAPAALADRWALATAFLAASVPLIVLGTSIARALPPSRASAIGVTAFLAAFWIGLSVLPAMAELFGTLLGAGAGASAALESGLEHVASASPLFTFAGIATDVGGVPAMSTTDVLWPLGVAIQTALAAAAWAWARRRRASGQDRPRSSSASRSASP